MATANDKAGQEKRGRSDAFVPRCRSLSYRSLWSVLSASSVLSIASAASLLSIGSFASILSIGSSNSILSIGSDGGFLSFGASRRSRIRRSSAASAEAAGSDSRHDIAREGAR
jgi:hypothetical protein